MEVALVTELLEQKKLAIGLERIRLRVGQARIDTRRIGTSLGVTFALSV